MPEQPRRAHHAARHRCGEGGARRHASRPGYRGRRGSAHEARGEGVLPPRASQDLRGHGGALQQERTHRSAFPADCLKTRGDLDAVGGSPISSSSATTPTHSPTGLTMPTSSNARQCCATSSARPFASPHWVTTPPMISMKSSKPPRSSSSTSPTSASPPTSSRWSCSSSRPSTSSRNSPTPRAATTACAPASGSR